MSQLWTIVDLTSGAVLCPAFTTPSTGSHPKDNGWSWDAARQKATKIATMPDSTTQAWTGSAWADDPAKLQVQLLASVKDEAERRKMLLYSPGGAKKAEYADKAREVAAWESLGGTAAAILTAFVLLSASAKAARFPWATASSTAFGDTVADAIARFKGGISRAGTVPAIGAAEERACAAIKAAATAAAKRQAAAAVGWPA